MKTKRIISAILLCAVVLSVAFCAVGCGKEEKEDKFAYLYREYEFAYLVVDFDTTSGPSNPYDEEGMYHDLSKLPTKLPDINEAIKKVFELVGKKFTLSKDKITMSGSAKAVNVNYGKLQGTMMLPPEIDEYIEYYFNYYKGSSSPDPSVEIYVNPYQDCLLKADGQSKYKYLEIRIVYDGKCQYKG